MLLVFAGFFTGLMVGLTGVGAGAIMTPVLLLVFGIVPTTAIGTDLLFAGLTKLVASRFHDSKGLIDWQIVKRLWIGSLPTSALMVIVIKMQWLSFDVDFLRQIIGVAVLVTALGMLLQRYLNNLGRKLRINDEVFFKTYQPIFTVAAGALLGILVTLTSVGAGAIGAVLLAYLYPLRLSPSRLVATDIVHAVPLALFAGFGHMFVGNVDFILLSWLLIGSVPGVLIGAYFSVKMNQKFLRAILAFVLCTIGIKLTFYV